MSTKMKAAIAGGGILFVLLLLAVAAFVFVIPRAIVEPTGGRNVSSEEAQRINDNQKEWLKTQPQAGATQGTQQGQALQSDTEAGGSRNPNDRPYANVYFEGEEANPFIDADEDALSTFALDGDTASFEIATYWADVTGTIDPDSVRVEEWVNASPQEYDRTGDEGVALKLDGARTIFPARYTEDAALHYRTLRVGVSMPEPGRTRPPVSVIFVFDGSGSMGTLLRMDRGETGYISALEGAKELAKAIMSTMREGDEAAAIVYQDGASRVSDWRPVDEFEELSGRIDSITDGGSTHVQAGIEMAYGMARTREDGRDVKIVVFTDGVANQGITEVRRLMEQITTESRNKTVVHTIGVALQGNYNDVLLEGLANMGNGVYRYVNDKSGIARFAETEAHLMLEPTIRDARIQVEFNHETVRKYRLMGYENRAVADSDFRDDTLDFGEPAAGRDVTALYEVRMQENAAPGAVLATATLRYRPHDEEKHTEISASITAGELDTAPEDAAQGLRRAAAVGLYAEIAKGTRWAECTDPGRIKDVLAEAILYGDFDNRLAKLLRDNRNLQDTPCQR